MIFKIKTGDKPTVAEISLAQDDNSVHVKVNNVLVLTFYSGEETVFPHAMTNQDCEVTGLLRDRDGRLKIDLRQPRS